MFVGPIVAVISSWNLAEQKNLVGSGSKTDTALTIPAVSFPTALVIGKKTFYCVVVTQPLCW